MEAAIDIANECDVFNIELAELQQIFVEVDGLSFDPMLYIDYLGNPGEPLATDFDGGGGLYGTNAAVEFTAVFARDYLVVVCPESREPAAGYVLKVS